MDTINWNRNFYHNIDHKATQHPQTSRKPSRSFKTWSMFGSLLSGVILAAGHAIFYSWLNGRQVDNTLSQTWVTNVGVAIAFGSKMMLVVAAGIAFAQYQWHIFRMQAFEVNEIDSITSLLDDIFALLTFRLWAKAPVLVIIAIITWLIPIATIFPPGTIRVALIPSNQQDVQKVAQLALSNNSNWATQSGTVATNKYADAAPLVYTAALSSGTTGGVLNIPHNSVNMSYNYQFHGPAVQCSRSNDQLRDTVVSHINITGSGGGFFYVSFVGGDEHGLFNTSGLHCDTVGTSNATSCYRSLPLSLQSGTPTFESLDITSNDTARLYVMMTSPNNYNLFECHLWNATYNVNFAFNTSIQNVTVEHLDYNNQVAANTSARGTCYTTEGQFGNGCIESSTVFAYQSIMQSFSSLYVGALYGHYELYTRYQTLVESLSTAPNFTGNVNPTIGLVENMEAQFQNITLSMLAFPSLRANDSRAEALPVILTQYPATYEFTPLKLYLAYGIAIGCTVVCILLGLSALHINGVSYSNKFSTFARMAKTTQLSHLVDDADNAADPCPENIKKARISALAGRGQELNPI